MTTGKLVIASANPGKIRELRHLLEALELEVLSQSEFGVTSTEETGRTFVENALIKARTALEHSGLPALGDDSGLVVDALDGEPGIHSSRFAGVEGDARANNDLLLERMRDVPEAHRGATFHCCLVLLRHARDPAPLIVTGTWHGRILETPQGDKGFGYDPLFYDPKLGASAAQLPLSEKNRVSHRGRALMRLVEALRGGE